MGLICVSLCMHAIPILYSFLFLFLSFIPVLIIAVWKPSIKYNDPDTPGRFCYTETIHFEQRVNELLRQGSPGSWPPPPHRNISYKVTGGREIKFQLWTWLTGESEEEKGIWLDGEFGEEDNSSKLLCGIRYYKLIYEKFDTWYSWESYLVYFQKVTLVKRLQSWKPKMGNH